MGATIEWLMLVGDHGGDPTMPRIAIMQAPASAASIFGDGGLVAEIP
jgi:hypothetical protein